MPLIGANRPMLTQCHMCSNPLQARITRHCLLLILSLMGGICCLPKPGFSAGTGIHLRAAKQELAHARTQQKFGVIESGNVEAFDAALESLQAAASQIALAHEAHEGTESELAAMEAEALARRLELEQLRRTSMTVFYGRFPLARALGLDKFPDNEEHPATFNAIGTVRRNALRSAFKKSSQTLPGDMYAAIVLVDHADLDDRQFQELTDLVDSEASLAFGPVANVKLCPGARARSCPLRPRGTRPMGRSLLIAVSFWFNSTPIRGRRT